MRVMLCGKDLIHRKQYVLYGMTKMRRNMCTTGVLLLILHGLSQHTGQSSMKSVIILQGHDNKCPKHKSKAFVLCSDEFQMVLLKGILQSDLSLTFSLLRQQQNKGKLYVKNKSLDCFLASYCFFTICAILVKPILNTLNVFRFYWLFVASIRECVLVMLTDEIVC